MTDMKAILPAKRKRPQISYAEPEDDLFMSFMDESIATLECTDDNSSDDDREYGPRKKTNKRKIRHKKRVRPLKPKTSKSEKPFRFLDLPPELRDYIYELALAEPKGVILVSKTKHLRRTIGRGVVWDPQTRHFPGSPIGASEQWSQLVPNLLAVSKQIHSEAIGYFYRQPIVLADMMTLHTFLAAIGPSNRLVLSSLIVKDWACGRSTRKAMNVAALTLLSTCSNLEKLYLDCLIGYLRTPKQLARQIFRDGHYFLEGFGVAKGKKDAAIGVLELNRCNFDSHYWDGAQDRKCTLRDSERFETLFTKELQDLLLN